MSATTSAANNDTPVRVLFSFLGTSKADKTIRNGNSLIDFVDTFYSSLF
jgi:hypothetical protein